MMDGVGHFLMLESLRNLTPCWSKCCQKFDLMGEIMAVVLARKMFHSGREDEPLVKTAAMTPGSPVANRKEGPGGCKPLHHLNPPWK